MDGVSYDKITGGVRRTLPKSGVPSPLFPIITPPLYLKLIYNVIFESLNNKL